jgi:hypothetical protein
MNKRTELNAEATSPAETTVIVAKEHRREETESLLEAAVKDVEGRVPTTLNDIKNGLPKELGSFPAEFVMLFGELFDFDKVAKVLDGRVRDWDKGFSGIVLTAIVGRLLDMKFDPSDNFYACNPRSLFELCIRPVLRERHKAPMGKSDPLNVAKGTKRLDDNWANRGRGGKVNPSAAATVKLVQWIAIANKHQLEKLLRAVVWVYLGLRNLKAQTLSSITLGPGLDDAIYVVQKLIGEATAGGATAQIIVEAILLAQHEQTQSKDVVKGVGGSVNATNTTSGKPADVWEEYDDSLHGYEVTTKYVDTNRVQDSANSVHAYLQRTKKDIKYVEITFLCHLPLVHVEALGSNISFVDESGIQFHFVELYQWLIIMLERIGADGRENVLASIAEYAQQPDTDYSVKHAWEKLSTRFSSEEDTEA